MKMKKMTSLLLVLALILLSACSSKQTDKQPNTPESSPIYLVNTFAEQFTMEDLQVDPETLSLSLMMDESIPLSLASDKTFQVSNFLKQDTVQSWNYPDENLKVSLEAKEDHLQVIFETSAEDSVVSFPSVLGEHYYLPIGEGRSIPSSDPLWIDYLSGENQSLLESYSMPFFAVKQGDYAIVYIAENPYRNMIHYTGEDSLSINLSHEFISIDPNKTTSYRIYVTDNSATSIAKIYRQYKIETEDFITLEQKAEKIPNIEKLYGAPHFYFWGERAIYPDNIYWEPFRKALKEGNFDFIIENSDYENIAEVMATIATVNSQDYADSYQKEILCSFLSYSILSENLYTPKDFPTLSEKLSPFAENYTSLSPVEKISFHKELLFERFPDVFAPPDTWTQKQTADVIVDMKESGISNAWIGLNDWTQGYANPSLVTTASEKGYLIGAYDSYHSIHKSGEEQWNTATFTDLALYETATVQNNRGEYEEGFQGVGRKLNPTLSLPEVEVRTSDIFGTGLPFNSWFVDCDATGEIYDDFSVDHLTTQAEDVTARIQRMNYIRDTHNVVIGSEGGHDFANTSIAFAHGIELPSFAWMDDDMRKNKESEYYLGKYFSPYGGVPEKFAKSVPIKEEYYNLFLNPKYQIPLYKLVYNDVIITSNHWDWSTLKINGGEKEQMLRNFLYNTPPMYHIDNIVWQENKDIILPHVEQWSRFHSAVIKEEMTSFEILTEDSMVQKTSYSNGFYVVANFGTGAYEYENTTISPMSALIFDGEIHLYTPLIK